MILLALANGLQEVQIGVPAGHDACANFRLHSTRPKPTSNGPRDEWEKKSVWQHMMDHVTQSVRDSLETGFVGTEWLL
jgi:hypothetical protein